MESILTSIKKMLGIVEDYTHFDTDLVMHINSTLSILTQLGVGPSEGFSIKDKAACWVEYIPENHNLEMIKTYVYLKVKMMFDPPTSSAVMEAYKQTISELEWRILVEVDPGKTASEVRIQNGG